MDDERATIAFSNSPPASEVPRSTPRVTVADLHRLPEESLRKVRCVALTRIRAAKDDTRRRPWLRLWSHAHFLLTARDGLAASDSQRMRTRPLSERLADARRALGLPEPPTPAVAASIPTSGIGAERALPAVLPRVRRDPTPAHVARARARAVLGLMSGEAERQRVRERAQAVRKGMTGESADEAVSERAAGVRRSLSSDLPDDVRQRVADARSALGLRSHR